MRGLDAEEWIVFQNSLEFTGEAEDFGYDDVHEAAWNRLVARGLIVDVETDDAILAKATPLGRLMATLKEEFTNGR